jgi:hypothetical protein
MENWFSLDKTEINVDFTTLQVLGKVYIKNQKSGGIIL